MKNIIKKLNWGWGIGLFYTCFVVFMLMIVYKASQQTIEFVTDDYYKKELDYQNHIDKVSRTAALTTQPQWQVKANTVLLHFPVQETGKVIKANVLFYRPSDSSKDVQLGIAADSAGRAVIASGKLDPGVYRMQIDWNAGGTAYYNEGIVNLNR